MTYVRLASRISCMGSIVAIELVGVIILRGWQSRGEYVWESDHKTKAATSFKFISITPLLELLHPRSQYVDWPCQAFFSASTSRLHLHAACKHRVKLCRSAMVVNTFDTDVRRLDKRLRDIYSRALLVCSPLW